MLNEFYNDCLLAIDACIDESDYDDILDMIGTICDDGNLTLDEYDKLKRIHHEKNHLFKKGIDDHDWELMKLSDTNLSEQ